MPAPRVTIAQVAAEAGVSSMTVSNVINARPGASDSTRQHVLDVVEKLGYTSPGTRNGKRGRTGLIAFGTLDAAHNLGLAIPHDLSIIGFDDLPQATHTNPPLTTVQQPLHDMGRAGTRALLSLIAHQPLPTDDIRLTTKLIIRATTAPPRRPDA